MNILTDEEMKQIHADTFGKGVQSFARAIEAAVLSKLAEQDAEPVAFAFKHSLLGFLYDFSETEHSNGMVRLYTEPQLLAAQQRTAEACAKVCNKFTYDNYQEPEEMDERDWADMCGDAIRNGDWREYL